MANQEPIDEVKREVNMIKARIDRLAEKLSDPTKRLPEGLETCATVTERLKLAIKTSGKTYRAIAEDADIDHVALGRFVEGKKDFNGQTIDRLAIALNLELTDKQ
jgi:hypothetical protein